MSWNPLHPHHLTGQSVGFICNGKVKWNQPLHHATTDNITSNFEPAAKKVVNLRVLSLLSAGDLHVKDAHLHLRCLDVLYNKSRETTSNTDLTGIIKLEGMAFLHLVSYIQSRIESDNCNLIFKTSDLVKMYRGLISHLLKIDEKWLLETNSMTLGHTIQEQFPQLKTHHQERNISWIILYYSVTPKH